ncbi:MAG: extracellular solute-binding protein [Clostridiales bacterium]|nr:extracellular solute-binding protein [Clostridiales bacterium]
MRNRILKSMLATVMVATLMVGTLTGCGQTQTTGTTEETAATEEVATGEETATDSNDTFIADRTITIQVYVDDIGYSLPEDINNTPVMQEITKRTGIKLDIQYTPGDSDSAVLSSQLAAGSIPDVIVTYLNDSTRPEFTLLLKAAKEGLLADVSSYFADSEVYSHYLEDGYLPNDAKNNITFRDDLDGAAYIMQLSIPAVDRSTEFNPQDAYLGGMYIQKSIAEALNIDPTQIKTQDDLYNLLVQIKDGGFTDDNGNAVYPLGPKYWGGSADSLEFITRGYDWGVSDGYNLDADGTVKHEVETDYAWEKVSFVRKLLAEGLMNPEFFTMDSTRAEEVSKTNNSAIIADVHNYQDVIYETGEWLPLGPLEDISGSQSTVVSGKKGYGAWAISSEAENPEEIFAFFDYLASYEGQLLCQYGVEGVSYNMVDGYPVLTDEVLTKLNEGDKEWLINNVGAGFGGSGCVFFYYILTNLDPTVDFGESRPGANASDTYAASVALAEQYPRTYKLVQGLDATAYLNSDEMTEVKARLSLLNYKETLVQAMFASSDEEAKSILDSFKAQIQSAGVADFEEYVKGIYDADNTAVNFYTE